MPATPFIGISILIHAGIIIYHKLFKVVPGARRAFALPTRRQYVVSALIVLSMFALMISTAVGLIAASVTEKHSTVYLVEDTVSWIASEHGTSQIAAAIESTYKAQSVGVAAGIIFFFAVMFTIPRIRLPRTTLPVNQGGHTAVSISLLISGIIFFTAGTTYLVLYILIAG
jgi:hypothetical protein